jgi:hypothetical protein
MFSKHKGYEDIRGGGGEEDGSQGGGEGGGMGNA